MRTTAVPIQIAAQTVAALHEVAGPRGARLRSAGSFMTCLRRTRGVPPFFAAERSPPEANGPGRLAPVTPLQKVAMGLVIVVVDPFFFGGGTACPTRSAGRSRSPVVLALPGTVRGTGTLLWAAGLATAVAVVTFSARGHPRPRPERGADDLAAPGRLLPAALRGAGAVRRRPLAPAVPVALGVPRGRASSRCWCSAAAWSGC